MKPYVIIFALAAAILTLLTIFVSVQFLPLAMVTATLGLIAAYHHVQLKREDRRS